MLGLQGKPDPPMEEVSNAKTLLFRSQQHMVVKFLVVGV